MNSHCPKIINSIPGVIMVYPIRDSDLGSACTLVILKKRVVKPGSKK